MKKHTFPFFSCEPTVKALWTRPSSFSVVDWGPARRSLMSQHRQGKKWASWKKSWSISTTISSHRRKPTYQTDMLSTRNTKLGDTYKNVQVLSLFSFNHVKESAHYSIATNFRNSVYQNSIEKFCLRIKFRKMKNFVDMNSTECGAPFNSFNI